MRNTARSTIGKKSRFSYQITQLETRYCPLALPHHLCLYARHMKNGRGSLTLTALHLYSQRQKKKKAGPNKYYLLACVTKTPQNTHNTSNGLGVHHELKPPPPDAPPIPIVYKSLLLHYLSAKSVPKYRSLSAWLLSTKTLSFEGKTQFLF